MDILISEELDAPAIQRLGEKFHLVRDGALWKNPAALKAAIRDARAILIRNQTQVTAEIIAATPRLAAIGRLGVGLDNIDVPAASEAGIVVIAPLDANATSVAELALGLMLALARRIPRGDRSTKTGGWDRQGCTGIELAGKTLAVCGFGRIGRKVASLARAFSMKVMVFDPFVSPDAPILGETGAALCGRLEEALAQADFVSAHMPLTAETRRQFSADAFGMMKRGAFFVNTSRGGLVDEAALLAALQSGQLRGAALDVRAVEPPEALGEVERLDNVILTPHIGAFTAEAQTRTFEAVADDIDRVLCGQPAMHFVNFAEPGRGRGNS